MTKPEFQSQVYTYYAPGWLDVSHFYLMVTTDLAPIGLINITNIRAHVGDNEGNCTVEAFGDLVSGGVLTVCQLLIKATNY